LGQSKRGVQSTFQLNEEPTWNSQDEYDSQPAYSTSEEASQATRDLAFHDTVTGLAARAKSVFDFEDTGAKKLTPEEANSKYPGMPTPFRDAVNPYVAQMLYDREQEKRELVQKINNGPQDIYNRSKNFGVGMLTHMMDPVEFGAGSVIGWGVGAGMTRLAWGARLAAAADTSFAARTALNSIEAFTGNTIQNVAQEYLSADVQENLEGVKYDPVQGMQNLAVSTIMGGVFGTAIKEGSFRFGRFLKNTSPEADLAIRNAMRGQYEAGIKPDPRPVIEALAKETDVTPQSTGGKFDYAYEAVNHENIKGKTFYVPHDAGDKFNPDNARMVGEEHGLGVQMTDNPGVANAAAARAMADAPGAVWEVAAKDVRPLNLNERLPEELKPVFEKAFGGIASDFDEAFSKHSGKEILEAAWNAVDEGDLSINAIKDLQTELKAKGYNAFVQDGSSVAGVEHSPHNLVTLFDHNDVETKGFREADPSVRNDPSSEKVREMVEARNAPENKTYVEPEVLKNADKLLEQADREGLKFEPSDDAEFIDQFKQMQEQGLIDENFMKEVESLKTIDKQFEDDGKVMRAVIGCVNG
jgi:hypothetical protein